MTLVACKAGRGESSAMALVWVSGVGSLYAYPAYECKVEIGDEAEHTACIVNMAICASTPGNLACWPTLAYMLTHVGTSNVKQLPPISKQNKLAEHLLAPFDGHEPSCTTVENLRP